MKTFIGLAIVVAALAATSVSALADGTTRTIVASGTTCICPAAPPAADETLPATGWRFGGGR